MADGTINLNDGNREFKFKMINHSGEPVRGSITITLPKNGFLEKLQDIFEEKKLAHFNLANILTPEVIAYCIERIEAKHSSRSQKAIGYIEIASLMMFDKRYANENVVSAKDFLLKYADKISAGIMRPAIESDFYRQRDVVDFVMKMMADICRQVKDADQRKVIIDPIINAYSSALADFFYVPPEVDRDEYSDTRDHSSHLFMQVLVSCGLLVPEFFKQARLAFLKGFAREAFDYANRPDGYTHHKALGISREFSGIAGVVMNEIGTRMDDPIHLAAGHDGEFLIMAREGNTLRYIFNAHIGIENIGFTAKSIDDLKKTVGAVKTGHATNPINSLERILGNISGGYGGL